MSGGLVLQESTFFDCKLESGLHRVFFFLSGATSHAESGIRWFSSERACRLENGR
jgi:hypothetical protein